jgi:outer membrane immunogenic protein
MRFLIAAVATTCLAASAAHAADLDLGPLRGTGYSYGADLTPVADWSGVYVGGFGGYGQSNFENKSGSKDLVYSVFRNSVVESRYDVSNLLQLKSKDSRDTVFGGFIGYNYQIDEAVLGIEADYSTTQLRGTSTDSIGRTMSLSDTREARISLAGKGTTELNGYGTVRVRAGYTVGAAMPFVTAGVALGQIETRNSATILWTEYENGARAACGTPGCAPQTLSNSKSTVAVGFTAGAGIEYMLTENIFLRSEYQYAFFDDYNGHKFNLNVVRGGAGVKF